MCVCVCVCVYHWAKVGDSPLECDEHVVEAGVDYSYIDICMYVYTYTI